MLTTGAWANIMPTQATVVPMTVVNTIVFFIFQSLKLNLKLQLQIVEEEIQRTKRIKVVVQKGSAKEFGAFSVLVDELLPCQLQSSVRAMGIDLYYPRNPADNCLRKARTLLTRDFQINQASDPP